MTRDTRDEKLTKTRRLILAAVTIVWGVLFVAVCRAIGAGAGDNTLLQWFDFVADRTDRLPVLGQGAWLAVWRAVLAVGVAVMGVRPVRRKGRRGLAGAALVLCVLCYAGEWRINRWTYEVPAGTAQQASALNDALAELDGRVLFIPYGVRQRDSQLIETYVARDVYIVEYETLLQSGSLADGGLDLTAEAVGPEYQGSGRRAGGYDHAGKGRRGVPGGVCAVSEFGYTEGQVCGIVSGHGRIWNPPLRKGVCRYRPTCFSAPQTGTGRRGRRPLQT